MHIIFMVDPLNGPIENALKIHRFESEQEKINGLKLVMLDQASVCN
jgi:hypothetical protein